MEDVPELPKPVFVVLWLSHQGEMQTRTAGGPWPYPFLTQRGSDSLEDRGDSPDPSQTGLVSKGMLNSLSQNPGLLNVPGRPEATATERKPETPASAAQPPAKWRCRNQTWGMEHTRQDFHTSIALYFTSCNLELYSLRRIFLLKGMQTIAYTCI